MKRRLLTTVIAALAAVLCAFVFVACGGDKGGDTHPDDTAYQGALSAETYATPNAAAKAFIDVEVSGDVTDATFVSYTKTADLTDEEVDALDISDAEKTEIASVEKGEVKYTVATGKSDVTVRTSADEEKSYFVIIVTYKDQTVKYYSPMLNTGDPLTKSYYDKVFSDENFNNVTLSYDLDIPIKASFMGLSFTMDTAIKMEGKWDADSYGYFKSTTTVDLGQMGVLMGLPSKKTTVTEMLYVNDKASKFYGSTLVRNTVDGEASEWIMDGMIQTPELGEDEDDYDEDDMLSMFMPAFDYSYFIKTKTGFKINSEKLTEYMNIALKDAFEQAGADAMGITLGKTSATADYYVYDGKLTESVVTLNCEYSMDMEGMHYDYVMNERITVKYSNYGNTEVVVPTDIDFESLA
ncbi:MAG: hypothetical protein K2I75_07160 [Clostridiales bacterium]|nr:hypothetical protein [Clostridiales bacterium]